MSNQKKPTERLVGPDFEAAVRAIRAAADALSKKEVQESLHVIHAAESALASIQDAVKAVATTDAAKAVAIQDAVKAVAIQDAVKAVATTDAAKAVAIQDAVKAVAIQDAVKAVAIQDAVKAVATQDAVKAMIARGVDTDVVSKAVAEGVRYALSLIEAAAQSATGTKRDDK